MPITILKPQPVAQGPFNPAVARRSSDSDSESDGGVDIHGDVNMADQDGDDQDDTTEVLTPGTIITSDPKWMRYVPFPSIFYYSYSKRPFY